ncbi:Gmad2 immunoglobulin-like domain-containing protein [Candidatus Peribacteria bacterium]|nr:MAG: Gmad2 immunoglobulin-like domain-containing protein [Candidatus Peribacteria bacterium]
MRTTFLSTSALLSLALLTACTTSPDGQQNSSSASSAQTSVSDSQVMIQISAPHANATVTSPLTVTGQARGNWYFEASFPVRLLDGNGNEIAITPAQAQSDWMTEDFVPFVATLNFTTPATPTGTLVLEKDNPSGLSENAAEVRIPVAF